MLLRNEFLRDQLFADFERRKLFTVILAVRGGINSTPAVENFPCVRRPENVLAANNIHSSLLVATRNHLACDKISPRSACIISPGRDRGNLRQHRACDTAMSVRLPHAHPELCPLLCTHSPESGTYSCPLKNSLVDKPLDQNPAPRSTALPSRFTYVIRPSSPTLPDIDSFVEPRRCDSDRCLFAENPMLLLASCCKVEVVNGGSALFFDLLT